MSSTRDARQSYLDGLRGLSILPVLLGHTFGMDGLPPILGAFFAAPSGVRVFFVISGFIITELLLEELATRGDVRLGAFYGRRLAKLLPVLWLYLLVLAAIKALHPVSYSNGELLAAATLTTAFLPATSWYAGHVWSLTVEEVFYATWAPALRALSVRKLQRIALSAIAIALVARMYNVLASSATPPRLTIPVLPHLDAVAIGCLVALSREQLTAHVQRLSRGARSVAYAGAWVLALAAATPATPFIDTTGSPWVRRGLWLLSIPQPMLLALAVAAILVIARAAWREQRKTLLDAPPLVLLGRASYSIYVIQQGICLPTPQRSLPFQTSFSPLLAIALGTLLFRYVEEPLRRRIVERLKLQRA